MNPYREPDESDKARPHCLGLTYVGTRTLGFEERTQLRSRIDAHVWRIVWKMLGVAAAGPALSFGIVVIASRWSAAPLVIGFVAFGFVATVMTSVFAVERVFALLRLKRDQRAGEVLRFEGVLPDDVQDEPGAGELSTFFLGTGTDDGVTRLEILPRSALVWRYRDRFVETPVQVTVRNNSARRT